MSSSKRVLQTVEAVKRSGIIPWGSWYGDSRLELRFPSGFEVDICRMRDAAALTAAEISSSVTSPISSPPLRELARDARTVAIAVDDITRPTPAADILPFVMEELAALPSENVKIIMALGAHRPMIREELEKKLGPRVLSTFCVEQHHPYENLVYLGKSNPGTPVFINRLFCEADLKIGVGCVLPHPYMGFSGGAKIAVPGLAGIDTLQSNHQPAVSGISGGLYDPEVDARKDIEQIGRMVGLNFVCNAVVNSERKIAGLFCGDPIDSHRAAVRFCKKIYLTPISGAQFDVLLLNAYPKDTELLQTGNALNCLRSHASSIVHQGGTIVIAACCSTGRGYHSLHGRDMRLHRAPVEKTYLDGRMLFFFSPNINRSDFEVSFSEPYQFFSRWEDLVRSLEFKHGGQARVGILPLAPLQIVA